MSKLGELGAIAEMAGTGRMYAELAHSEAALLAQFEMC